VEADYVIVGAGSAGCVLANRLSADPANRVLLLEAGPPDDALSLKIPSAMAANLAGRKHNWAFDGEPEPRLGGRRVRHDRGKTLGGSSSINGMVYIRGHAADYDGWRQMDCAGWGYADVLPYFKRAETFEGGADAFRGGAGPLHVSLPRPLHPLSAAFLKAGAEAGYGASDDINGYRQEGFALLNRTIRGGERWSAARAYLRPASGRPNLTVRPEVLALRVEIEDGRAVGVAFRDAAGGCRRATACKEVVLSAGAVGSPHLLMLSGIGPAAHLQAHGIVPIADRPGVGANLNDHPDFVVKIACKQPVTLWPDTRWPRKGLVGLRWLLRRDGVCASNHFDVVACLRSGKEVAYPDLQFTLAPIATAPDSWDPLEMHAFQIHVGLMRAHSRGSLRLTDGDPLSAPKIRANYLDDPRDGDRLRRGVRLVRRLVDMPAFGSYRGKEIFPGAEVQSDAQLDAALRAGLGTQWHLSCTAKMGPASDPTAVVDPAGRVYGVAGLRVVDASIMPEVVNGNTNGPTIMIAEKLSDAILGKPPLPQESPAVWDGPIEGLDEEGETAP